MKVLQINVVCGNGSTGRIAVDIANMLKSKGDECYIAYGFGQTEFTPSFRITNNTEYRINVHFFNKLGLQGRGTKWGTKRLLKWIDQIQPDIIHLHNIHGVYLNYPMLFNYIREKKIPVVWTLHDCWSFTGSCAHFSAVGCEKWKTGCHHCTYNGTYKEKSWYDTSKSSFQLKKRLFTSVPTMVLTPVSHWLGNLVKESFLKDVPMKVINNGIDLTIFKPKMSDLKRRLGIDADKPVILGVSSGWSNSKGLKEFIQLSQDTKYQIVLVGVQEQLKSTLPSNIIAISRTHNQAELAEYYSMADVFVNPTYNDSFSTVNIEALACGTPVVTFETDGCPETVGDNNCGEIVKQGDFEGLKKAIGVILEKSKKDYSGRCVERAKQHFEKYDRYNDYYEVYNQILEKQKI